VGVARDKQEHPEERAGEAIAPSKSGSANETIGNGMTMSRSSVSRLLSVGAARVVAAVKQPMLVVEVTSVVTVVFAVAVTITTLVFLIVAEVNFVEDFAGPVLVVPFTVVTTFGVIVAAL